MMGSMVLMKIVLAPVENLHIFPYSAILPSSSQSGLGSRTRKQNKITLSLKEIL
jgi:hypothetical protein